MAGALIFDVETTDRRNGEIIEAAWLRIAGMFDEVEDPSDAIPERPFQIEDRSVDRYKPSTPSTFGAIAVHHILPEELEGWPPSASFRLPANVHYLIGHSIDFDWEAAGCPAVKRICTNAMAHHVWPDATGYSQVALIYMLLGPTPATRDMVRQAHGALADVHLCLTLLQAILALRPEITAWAQLWAFSEECRIPRTCPMKKYEGVLLDDLDDGFIGWCLRQDWLDPYFRIGLNRVLEKRYPAHRFDEDEAFESDEESTAF